MWKKNPLDDVDTLFVIKNTAQTNHNQSSIICVTLKEHCD